MSCFLQLHCKLKGGWFIVLYIDKNISHQTDKTLTTYHLRIWRKSFGLFFGIKKLLQVLQAQHNLTFTIFALLGIPVNPNKRKNTRIGIKTNGARPFLRMSFPLLVDGVQMATPVLKYINVKRHGKLNGGRFIVLYIDKNIRHQTDKALTTYYRRIWRESFGQFYDINKLSQGLQAQYNLPFTIFALLVYP